MRGFPPFGILNALHGVPPLYVLSVCARFGSVESLRGCFETMWSRSIFFPTRAICTTILEPCPTRAISIARALSHKFCIYLSSFCSERGKFSTRALPRVRRILYSIFVPRVLPLMLDLLSQAGYAQCSSFCHTRSVCYTRALSRALMVIHLLSLYSFSTRCYQVY